MNVDIVVRLGYQHNKWIVIIQNYDGPHVIGDELFVAIDAHLDRKHGNEHVKDFDHVEILGYEISE